MTSPAEWQPPQGPVEFTVSAGQRIKVAVILGICWLIIVVLCQQTAGHLHPDAAALVVLGVVAVTIVFVVVFVMYGRARIVFDTWWVTVTAGLHGPRTFDARMVHKIRPYRNRSTVNWCVWVDDAGGRARKIVVPTASWGNTGPAANHLLSLVSNGAPGVDADRHSQRELSDLRGL